MELQRQVLLVTWAILLTLHDFVHPASTYEAKTASHQGDSIKAVNFTEVRNSSLQFQWFHHFSKKTLWRNNISAKNSSVPSLLGVDATCVEMAFLAPRDPSGTVPLPNLLVTYKTSSLKEGAYFLDIDLKSSEEGKPNDTLRFTFSEGDDPKLENRTVEYKLLNYNNTCSILETSAGQTNCSYWVLYTGDETTVPEWCKPTSIDQCDVEVHTTIAPTECEEESTTEV
ncbi:uncharacterized protein LOC115330823 [Ixodes scapularis]|uniref:uncharacterized protein LOC115330823 n=1 Tax=Ixodes scapularis TaxID=6945 RepID=UPI001C383729|nr:uncharacterized protein LOC115330823 [Ixodes scapularis]